MRSLDFGYSSVLTMVKREAIKIVRSGRGKHKYKFKKKKTIAEVDYTGTQIRLGNVIVYLQFGKTYVYLEVYMLRPAEWRG